MGKDRRLVRRMEHTGNRRMYELLKPYNGDANANPLNLDDWENVGRKYFERGILSFVFDSNACGSYDLFFYPMELEEALRDVETKRRGLRTTEVL